MDRFATFGTFLVSDPDDHYSSSDEGLALLKKSTSLHPNGVPQGELALLPSFDQLGDQFDDLVEADPLPAPTSFHPQGGGQIGLARPGVTDQQHILPAVEVRSFVGALTQNPW